MSAPTLKRDNRIALGGFVLLLLVVTALTAGLVPTVTTIQDLAKLDVSKSIPPVVASGLLLLLGNLVGQRGKARIVYLRWQNAEPGHRAFTHFALNDGRFDTTVLAEKLGRPLPTEPGKQNECWYGLYVRNKDDDSVQSTHREWLLYRDLTCFATLWLPVGAALLIYRWDVVAVAFFALLGGVWLVVMRSARGRGDRFVSTVLAIAATRNTAGPPTI